MIEKNQWSDPFNFCSGIYSYLKDTFQQVGFQFGGPYWHFFPAQTGHVLSTQTYGQGPAGALTICFEERISANRRGILKLAAFNSSHYQFENEPFAKKNGQGSR